MSEFLTSEDRRTCYCAEVTESMVGSSVCVMGWVQRRRDLGSLVFIDLRDRTGIVQLAFGDGTDPEVFEKALSCRAEYVICVHGEVVKRGGAVNTNLKTGAVEIDVKSMKILSAAQTPPIEVNDSRKVKDET
ncbi:MAG: Asp-tRNA(Asn)/Glu-tRNA(Gln) amidotransferase GatCAB subunit C, partial [Clostridia bacterium]|nr:Asp-tRNA(Asn)/Glu-tRNA(Gln) amidotransferase GatCAB subunit C [Clostridia bacterium]